MEIKDLKAGMVIRKENQFWLIVETKSGKLCYTNEGGVWGDCKDLKFSGESGIQKVYGLPETGCNAAYWPLITFSRDLIYESKKSQVVLSKDYTALILETEVKVGCQIFPREAVAHLLNLTTFYVRNFNKHIFVRLPEGLSVYDPSNTFIMTIPNTTLEELKKALS